MRIKSNAAESGVEPFSMPALKDTYSIGRSVDYIEREAYEKGYAAGEKAGFEMGEEKAKVLVGKLEALIAEIAALRSRIVKETATQCVEISLSVARKILARELTTKPEEIVKMAKEGLQKLERTGLVTIKVNPLLYDFFMKHKPELSRIHPEIAFDADPAVSRYGAVVMGPVEDVVTDMDEQIKNIVKDMADRLGHEYHGSD
jgi:flagellar assembly protein FliH